jgi:cell wall-associated NlpC family hydrolase
MTANQQLLNVSKFLIRLIGTIGKVLVVWLFRGVRFVYQHRMRIARHPVTLPGLVVLSVFWSGYGMYRHYSATGPAEPVSEFPVVLLPAENEKPVSVWPVNYSADDEALTTAASANPYVLIQEIYGWLGTPHRDGGNTKRGTDCSGFVQAVYQDAFGLTLSRSSRDIYRNDVAPILKKELREGDLVFFRTYGKSISHVGIFLRNGMFAHTSSSRGVIVDSLNDPYFRRTYVASGRVIGVSSD